MTSVCACCVLGVEGSKVEVTESLNAKYNQRGTASELSGLFSNQLVVFSVNDNNIWMCNCVPPRSAEATELRMTLNVT